MGNLESRRDVREIKTASVAQIANSDQRWQAQEAPHGSGMLLVDDRGEVIRVKADYRLACGFRIGSSGKRNSDGEGSHPHSRSDGGSRHWLRSEKRAI